MNQMTGLSNKVMRRTQNGQKAWEEEQNGGDDA
jgi:hypothetical protein